MHRGKKAKDNDRYRSIGALREGIVLWLGLARINRTMECASFLCELISYTGSLHQEKVSVKENCRKALDANY
jgi:hypothetical protein